MMHLGAVMNDTAEQPYPEWQGPLKEAVLETDLVKLSEKALTVETLILERLRELQQSNDGHGERAAIDHGLSILRRIRRERLGYPEWQ